MNEKLISGDWVSGSLYQDPDTNKITDDKENKARFFEHEIIDTAKSNKLNKVYRKIVKCDIKTTKTRDLFSALVKENSSKHLELMYRFPNAWKSFIEKGGSFGEENRNVSIEQYKNIEKENKLNYQKKEYEKMDKRTVDAKLAKKENEKLERNIGGFEKHKDISSKIEDIEFLKKEYEALEDKRSARGKEIRAELKKLEG